MSAKARPGPDGPDPLRAPRQIRLVAWEPGPFGGKLPPGPVVESSREYTRALGPWDPGPHPGLGPSHPPWDLRRTIYR